jgi:hypothetical protein
MDGGEGTRRSCRLRCLLLAAVTAVEAEKRRRTFWVNYVLDWYASIRTSSRPTFKQSEVSHAVFLGLATCNSVIISLLTADLFAYISTFLLSSDFTPDGISLAPQLFLQDALLLSTANPKSSFPRRIIAISLFTTCVGHLSLSKEDDLGISTSNYSFWSHDYRIDKVVAEQSALFLNSERSDVPMSDYNAVLASPNLSAISILMHQAPIDKATEANLPETLIVESENRCAAVAMQAATTLARGDVLHPKKVSKISTSVSASCRTYEK